MTRVLCQALHENTKTPTTVTKYVYPTPTCTRVRSNSREALFDRLAFEGFHTVVFALRWHDEKSNNGAIRTLEKVVETREGLDK